MELKIRLGARKAWLAGAVGLLSARSLIGQQDAPAFTLRVETHEVLVDVVAVDRSDHVIEDLGREDVEVFLKDKGQPALKRVVSAFRKVQGKPEEPDDHASGGLRVTLGRGCAEKVLTHYEVAFRPGDEGLTSGFHQVLLTTGRKGTQLHYRRRYFVGATPQQDVGRLVQERQSTASLLEAACFHAAVPASLVLSGKLVETRSGEPLKGLITINPESMTWVSIGETGGSGLDYGLCIFSRTGEAMRFMGGASSRTLVGEEYRRAIARGLTSVIEFPSLAEASRVRFVVRDAATGNLGAVELALPEPSPADLKAAEQEGEALWKLVRARGNGPDRMFPAPGPVGTFGSIIPSADAFCGDVYELPESTLRMPDFWSLETVGTLYAHRLEVPNQMFSTSGGLPGATRKTDGFAIDYRGDFWVKVAGKYEFALVSDDGSKLFVDDALVIDNDGAHMATERRGTVQLSAGKHAMRVPYFQGKRYSVALVLLVKAPGAKWAPFDLREFAQPK